MTDWPARSNTNLEAVEAVQGRLPVSLIMVPRADLVTCRPDETVSDINAKNTDRFSYWPVIDDAGGIIGLHHAEPWFDIGAPNETVAARMEPLCETNLIGADASILDFVRFADREPIKLVVSGKTVAGLVSLSDLQQLPVRAALFMLITNLEIQMAEIITRRWELYEDWMQVLNQTRQDKVREKYAESLAADGLIDPILFTDFCDKKELLLACRYPSLPTTSTARKLRAVERVRNSIAHASDFALTPDQARTVAKTVREMMALKAVLENELSSPAVSQLLSSSS